MAGISDPSIGASVIGQSVAPSCAVRNFVSDELGRILMVPASSAPLNVSVPASTAPISLTTGNVISLTTTSVVGLTTVSVVGLTSTPIFPSTAATYPVAVSSAITLTSGTLTLGAITNSSFTVAGAITNTSFTVAGTAEVVPTSTVGTQSTVSVTSSTAAQLLLAPNASRKGVIVFAGTSPVYLAFTSTAAASQPSTTNYSVSVAGNTVYPLTLGSNAMFTGGVLAVSGLLTASTVKVTEFT